MTASLIRRSEVNVGASPVEFNYTGAADIIAAQYRNQMMGFNYLSSVNRTNDIYKENFDKYVSASGSNEKEILDYTKTFEEQYGKFDTIILQKREQGDQAYMGVMTSDEIHQEAKRRAEQAANEAATTSAQASPDTWVWGSEVIGSAGGWLSDPAHLVATVATLPLSAEFGVGRTVWGTIAKTAGVEAALEMGVETFVQTGVLDWQKRLGTDYGVDDAAMSVLMAGAFAGVFTGGAMGVAKGFGAKIPTHDLIALDKEMARQAMIQPPKVTDSELLEAHYRNVDYLSTQLNDVESPRLAIEPSAIGQKFSDDAVTHDHLAVARSIPETLDLDTHAKAEFIREMINEYQVNSGLARGDVGKMVERQQLVTAELKSATESLTKKTLELEAHNKLPADEMTAQRTTLLERDIGILKDKVSALKKSQKSLDSRIVTSSKAIEADEYLGVLNLGDIPAPLKPRYETYLNNVKKADSEFKSWSRRIEKAAKDIMPKGDFVGPPTQRLMEAMNSFVGPVRRGVEFDIPEPKAVTKAAKQIDEATDAAFNVEVKKSVTGESKALHDAEDMDGNMVKATASDIDDMIKEEESFLAKFKSCFLGGGK